MERITLLQYNLQSLFDMFAYFDVLVCFLFENDKLFPRNKITYHDNEQQLTPETPPHAWEINVSFDSTFVAEPLSD